VKKHSSFSKSGKASAKEAKPMRRESQNVMSELVEKMRKQLDGELVVEPEDKGVADWERPNLDRLTVGVDVGDQWSNYCILGLGGETLAEGQFKSQPAEVREFFQDLAESRVAMEVGTHSAWMREVICELGHEVLVANSRRMQGSKRRRRKNDRIDAARLARLGRVDPSSLYPIQHRSTEVREDLLVLRAREVLVESRTKLISAVRSMVKTVGARVPSSSSDAFSRKAAAEIPQQIRDTAQPLLNLIAQLSDEIKSFDKKIEQMAEEKYQHTKLLRQVTGVGPVTALAYALTLETPLRFKKSRDVGPYLGLVPKHMSAGVKIGHRTPRERCFAAE
jgi:transposase